MPFSLPSLPPALFFSLLSFFLCSFSSSPLPSSLSVLSLFHSSFSLSLSVLPRLELDHFSFICRYKLTHSEYVTKLPGGKHSTMGQGRTAPDPKGYRTTESGMVIPMGKGTDSGISYTSLLYNEYPSHTDNNNMIDDVYRKTRVFQN